MTHTRPHSPARYDRAAIMRDAHKRHRDGRRLGMGWTFAHCLTTAWAAARIRRQRDATTSTLATIAATIDQHLARRIPPALLTGKEITNDAHRMGFRILDIHPHIEHVSDGREVCRRPREGRLIPPESNHKGWDARL